MRLIMKISQARQYLLNGLQDPTNAAVLPLQPPTLSPHELMHQAFLLEQAAARRAHALTDSHPPPHYVLWTSEDALNDESWHILPPRVPPITILCDRDFITRMP